MRGDGAGEERGKVLGVALEWAGTSCRRVRRNWDGKITEVFAGVDMTTGPYTLDPGVTFTTQQWAEPWAKVSLAGPVPCAASPSSCARPTRRGASASCRSRRLCVRSSVADSRVDSRRRAA